MQHYIVGNQLKLIVLDKLQDSSEQWQKQIEDCVTLQDSGNLVVKSIV